MINRPQATIQDLYAVPENGKAELVNGALQRMSPTGGIPGRAAGKIFLSLARYEEAQGGGYAFGDNVGFIVDLPDRKSFSPDAAWYVGDVESMRFLVGAPAFAVEVRSENDYGPTAERAIAKKIADYFAAGTQVVWDVDLLGEDVVTVYRFDASTNPTIYRHGDTAEAEPALSGWTMPVHALFNNR